jgi:DDE superfamily endonuclease
VATSCSVPPPAGVGQGDLRRFRADFYDCLTARADGLFELLDGLCSPVPVAGVAHVTLAAASRRGHGSAYAALARGGIDADLLADVLAAHRPTGWRPDFAVDVTTWARCDAECSPGRGFYYHPSRHSAGQPIVAGWCYLWLAGLSASADSWTAPLYAHRLAVDDNLNTVAAAQVRALLPRLGRLPATPLFAFDAGFDPVQLSVGLSDVPAQAVVRIRDDRKFFTPPPPPRPGRGGRPRRHGDRFSCADPATWPAPDTAHRCDDDQYGRVDVRAWHRLHPHQRTYRDPSGAMTIVEATIIRLQVSRLPGRRDRTPKTLWLWWTGPDPAALDLDRVWRAYIRRFDIEHVRHEAHETVCGARPHRRAVAAARQKQGAAGPGERRERWKAAPTTPGRVGTTRRPGFGKRDQKVERE